MLPVLLSIIFSLFFTLAISYLVAFFFKERRRHLSQRSILLEIAATTLEGAPVATMKRRRRRRRRRRTRMVAAPAPSALPVAVAFCAPVERDCSCRLLALFSRHRRHFHCQILR
jgi:uncharacterized membrane protein YbhN (UPF0104 family)